MQTTETILEKSEAAIFGRVFANGRQVMSPELARHILGLTFGEQDKARMHELAVGNQEGALSAEDKEELHNYIKVGHLLSILQSKARRSLKRCALPGSHGQLIGGGSPAACSTSVRVLSRPEEFYQTPFEIDHIIARQHSGRALLSNLALSCLHCNGHKGPNIAGLDPLTGKLTKLFHPRRHSWDRHFRWVGPYLVGRSPVGRVAIAVLAMNDQDAVKAREELIAEGVFPPVN